MSRSDTGDFSAVVVAAGHAARFDGPVAKQFCDLAGRSVLERSVRSLAAHPAVIELVVVLSPEELATSRSGSIGAWPEVTRIVAGGATRAHSVLAGLDGCRGGRHVLIHDAARPGASPGLVDAVIEATRKHGAAIPALPVRDTIKSVVGDRVEGTVDRDLLRLAQTPQGARRDWIVPALQQALERGDGVTDEASALEMAGRPVVAVPGELANRKITTAEDLEDAARRLAPAADDFRVGTGFDIHRVDADRPLRLGGLAFDGEPGLAGHSDADVVLHAAMDSLLGAAGLGDIGLLFPPEDPAYAGADSALLAREVAGRVSGAGFRVVNIDLTLLSEAPKIRPVAERMRQSIADCFGIPPTRVGLKATTLERLGALGRREGMACEAVALLVRDRGQ